MLIVERHPRRDNTSAQCQRPACLYVLFARVAVCRREQRARGILGARALSLRCSPRILEGLATHLPVSVDRRASVSQTGDSDSVTPAELATPPSIANAGLSLPLSAVCSLAIETRSKRLVAPWLLSRRRDIQTRRVTRTTSPERT